MPGRARGVAESLTALCRQGLRLLEQDPDEAGAPVEPSPADDPGADPGAALDDGGPDGDDDDPLAAFDGEVTGNLKLRVEMEVGRAAEDTQVAAVKLLKRYRENFHGGVAGLSRWDVTRMRVRLHAGGRAVEFRMWLDVKAYEAAKVLSDVVQQISAAALELAGSMSPKDARRMLGDATPDKVVVEPLDFVAAG